MNLRVKQPLIDIEDFERGPEPLAGDQSAFDLAALVRIIYARKTIVIGAVAAAMVLTLAVFAFITPTFTATAVMMLDQRKNAVADVNSVLSGLPSDPVSIQNQIQVLTSRQLALRVVDKLKLDRDPEFNTELTPGVLNLLGSVEDLTSLPIAGQHISPGRQAAVNKLLKRLNVEQLGMSTAMAIGVASVDAEKSARITNAFADAYVENQLNEKFEAQQKAVAWLSNRVRLMATQVQNDQAAVQTYKAQNGIVDTAGGGSIIDQQTVSVSVQLINAKADLAQKSALYNRTLELQRAGRAVEASQIVASPLIAQLRAQQADLQRQEAQLSSRYLQEHPKMVDVQSQRHETNRKIAAEVSRVIDSLANDVAVGRANVESLQGSLDQLQAKFQNQNGASAKLKALESIATSSRSIYEGLLSRLEQIQGQEGIATPDSGILSRAMVPTVASPRFLSVMGIALLASLVLGLLLAFLAEAFDGSLRTTEHVDKYLGLPVLATVPEASAQTTSSHGVAELVVYEQSSSFAESIRGLHLGLSLSNPDKSPKVLLVTSAVPGEGKTVIAVSLARLAARNGRRVIIIDADFRRPAVARTMGLSTPVGGIVDVLEGRLSLERCVVGDGRSHAAVLAGADRPANPSDLMTSDAIDKLIASLRGKYDLVIVDSAPLLPVHDTLALAQLSDTALFVTQSGKTPREAIAQALRSLRSTKVAIAGVALTRSKIDPRYGYHDYLYGTRPVAEAAPAAAPFRQALAAPAGVFNKLRGLVTASPR